MTVYKGFMTITKRNLPIAIMYLAIFLTVAILAQKMDAQGNTDFESQKLNIAVIDRDGGPLSAGLCDYLARFHNLKDLPDDPAVLQDRLFYREIQYVVILPENAEERCLKEGKKLAVTKIPGSASGFYADQQINDFLNDVKTLTDSGFSTEEAVTLVNDSAAVSPEVTVTDGSLKDGAASRHGALFQYLPYILMSICCYVLSYIMLAFHKLHLRRRMLCSAVSIRSQNLQLILGYLSVGFFVWLFCSLLPVILYREECLGDPNLPYYLLNALLVTLVSLALAFLISCFVRREDAISGIVNVLTLGMAFSCGVFVDMDVLGKGIKSAARFLPVYWYEINNRLLKDNAVLSQTQLRSLCSGYAIQLLFAAAFLCIAVVINRQRRQTAG